MNPAASPLISVIIPLYNAEMYIGDCINSVLKQTWSNIEIIIVDDGSNDQSLTIAKAFESERVNVLHQDNQGASAARNTGLAIAKGDYIQFLDADDLLGSNKLAAAVSSLSGHLNAISVCPVVHFNDNDKTPLEQLKPSPYELEFYSSSNDTFDFLLNLYGGENNQGSMIPLHSWLTPAHLIKKAGRWNESLTVNDDGEFFCRVVLQSQQIVFTNEALCYYRKYINKASVSAGKSNKALRSQYRAIMLKKAHLESHRFDERIDKIVAHQLMHLLMSVYPFNKYMTEQITYQLKQCKTKVSAPPIGGGTIELIKKIFGWKVARNLQYYLNR